MQSFFEKYRRGKFPLARFALTALSCCGLNLSAHCEDADWPVYLGGKARNLYSPLEQINRENVSQLEVAWTYDTPGTRPNTRRTISS